PEGGWTEDEVARLVEAGAVPVSLGPRVLRVETAGIAIAAAVAMHVASAGARGRRPSTSS
ncbi:MAG: RsmE family RNA methyltransferase, partial [Planctomycetes bacterium]|nr:RsmE family RNA methyltransferase [Planctomycetota bacterium]